MIYYKNLITKVIDHVAIKLNIDASLLQSRFYIKNNAIYIYVQDLSINVKRSNSFLFNNNYFHRVGCRRLPIEKSINKIQLLKEIKKAINIHLGEENFYYV